VVAAAKILNQETIIRSYNPGMLPTDRTVGDDDLAFLGISADDE
jgi:hypothetical protein